MNIKRIIREKLVDYGLYYSYLNKKFYHLGHNQVQFQFYQQFFKNVELTFDIGANIGQRAKIFGDLGSSVVCFEPQPYCLRHLKSRFGKNSAYRIENSAIGAEDKDVSMYLSSEHVISTISAKHRDLFGKKVFKTAKWDKEIVVSQNTLDWAIEKYGMPDFLKIDVEGYEANVLRGLSRPVPMISFEFTPMQDLLEDTIECIRLLSEISSAYRFNYSLGEDLSFQLNEFVSPGELLRKDVFTKAHTFGDIYAFISSEQDRK